jgi:hypothetical protein
MQAVLSGGDSVSFIVVKVITEDEWIFRQLIVCKDKFIAK